MFTSLATRVAEGDFGTNIGESHSSQTSKKDKSVGLGRERIEKQHADSIDQHQN